MEKHSKFFGLILLLLAVVSIQLYQLIKVQRADLRRELILNSAVNCFAIENVEEIIDIKNARKNCRNSMYSIEREFGW